MPDEETVAGIALPDDITPLDDKALEKHLAAIAKKFAPYNDENRTITAEDLAEMNALVEQKELLQGEQTARATAAAEAKATRDALVQRMGGEEPPAEGDPAEEAPPAEEASVEEPPAEGESVEEAPPVEAIAASAAGAPKAKTAVKGGFRTAPRTVSAAKTRVDHKPDHLSIVASSDVPGFATGRDLSREELGQALHARARGLRDGSDAVLVASIINNEPAHNVSDILDDEGIRRAWADAHDIESMVASGGWCAPSETIYDFVCDYESMPEALDLPGVTSTRGGIRYPDSPLLADVYDDVNSGFTWLEADDVAAASPGGPTKPCYSIPCPSFNEVRLQAQGICVTAGNLTDRAYPELTSRYIDLVMTAHAHRMNALTIAKVVAASTDVTPTLDADLGAAESTLGVVEFLVDRFRDAFFAGADFTLEGVLPRWARSVIRRDIARRNGLDSVLQVSNADIASAFAEIGARFQFVSNYQPLGAAAVVYPSTVQLLLYPAGAHTRLDGGSLDVGVVRDSTLNATNDYTAAWTEEFWGVISRCASFKSTVPIVASGTTGSQKDFTATV
jgi:hypothetical protein